MANEGRAIDSVVSLNNHIVRSEGLPIGLSPDYVSCGYWRGRRDLR